MTKMSENLTDAYSAWYAGRVVRDMKSSIYALSWLELLASIVGGDGVFRYIEKGYQTGDSLLQGHLILIGQYH
jgi:hypothetical protein